ncbi:predicted protein [Histoplasma capsulatum G186AR]|uniref:Uncharacterized protein n=2 Tax=Ajellomyces capsulatus TaxID=5037 RepID=C0NRG4_AJECG|nr:uncharacterized protein HCBG_05594 [Histoplasma capsulatum G186AR]EEH06278.1 predicted protein [Histoplasma capsulatum G186AR]KAG5293266.1 hypothetical protein I7I52_04530 [Histoplasma capsulatum]QSS74717.1 hypothetical protein I7I50_03623 [Histoplasma capsulatum G186AR]
MFTNLFFSAFPEKKIISVTAFFHGNETEYSFWPARRVRGNYAQAPASLRYARLRPPTRAVLLNKRTNISKQLRSTPWEISKCASYSSLFKNKLVVARILPEEILHHAIDGWIDDSNLEFMINSAKLAIKVQ